MALQVFNDPGALVSWVVANSILQAKIVKIQFVAGKWYLFYYTA